MTQILILVNIVGGTLYKDLLESYKQHEPPTDNSTVTVGLDLWVFNQIDAVEQVFDVNLIVELEWTDSR